MRRDVLCCCMAALLFCITQCDSQAQWKRATGFSNAIGTDNTAGFFVYGNYLLADALCPHNLPGATNDSLFASTDHGETWKPFSANGGVPLASLGTTLIGSADTTPGVFNTGGILSYSSNNGKTWRPDTLGWPIPNGSAMSIAELNGTIYMASAAGIYRQSSPTSRWTPDTVGMTIAVQGTLFTPPVTCVIAAGNVLYAAAGFYGGIFVSTNNGVSWKAANNGLPTIDTVTQWLPTWGFAISGSTVYAMIDHDSTDNTYDFYRTANNGTSWIRMNAIPQNWTNIRPQIVASGQDLFAATNNGFYYSLDGGANWKQSNEGLPTANGSYVNALQVSGNNIVLSTFQDGLWVRPISELK